MPKFLSDGSIISQSFFLSRKKTSHNKKYKNHAIVKARVDEVIYTDDERNTSKGTSNPEVQYVCTVLGGSEAGRRIYGVTSVVPFGTGSQFNSSEIIHTPFLKDSPKDRDGNDVNQPEKTTGSFVLLSRVHGSINNSVIISTLKHPASPATAKKEEGQRLKYEFQGIGVEITKDGAFSLTFGGGPKDKDGKPASEDKAGGSFQLSKDGTIKMQDGKGQEIIIDPTNSSIKINSSQGVEMSTGSDWKIDVGGNVNLSAGGSVSLDGAIINIGAGGQQAARINDIVLGTDSRGGPINAYIGQGSSTVLIGG